MYSFLPLGTAIVSNNEIPAVTIVQHKVFRLPHLFNVNSSNEYPGISTAPLITKLSKSFPPKFDVFHDNP